MLEAIQAKVDGQEIVADEPQAQETKIIDLMEALKASLSKSGKAPAGKAPAMKVEKGGKAAKSDRGEKRVKKAARG